MTTHGVQLDSVYHTGVVEVKLTDTGHRFDILPDQAYDHIHPRLSKLPRLLRAPSGSISERWRSAPADIEPCATPCVQFMDRGFSMLIYVTHGYTSTGYAGRCSMRHSEGQ